MAKIIEKSAKTVEDALKAALEELGVSEDKVSYEVLEEASKGLFGLLGRKPAKIRVTIKENDSTEETPIKIKEPSTKSDEQNSPKKEEKQVKEQTENIIKKDNESSDDVNAKIETAEKFLQAIFKNMNLVVKIEITKLEEGYFLNLCGENLGILIGKHGQTLDALQYLVNLAANRNHNTSQRVRVIIDVENYRSRRAETLQNLAKTLADRAVRLNQDVRLEPMNRHERRVIHTALQDNDDVSTYSVGEDPNRYIIISPKKYEKDKK